MTAQRLARRLVRPRRDRCRDAKARLRSVADPPVGRPSAHLEADAVAGRAGGGVGWYAGALGRRSTIVGVPPSAVPNFSKSLIVVGRRGFSDAARRSIVSRG